MPPLYQKPPLNSVTTLHTSILQSRLPSPRQLLVYVRQGVANMQNAIQRIDSALNRTTKTEQNEKKIIQQSLAYHEHSSRDKRLRRRPPNADAQSTQALSDQGSKHLHYKVAARRTGKIGVVRVPAPVARCSRIPGDKLRCLTNGHFVTFFTSRTPSSASQHFHLCLDGSRDAQNKTNRARAAEQRFAGSLVTRHWGAKQVCAPTSTQKQKGSPQKIMPLTRTRADASMVFMSVCKLSRVES